MPVFPSSVGKAAPGVFTCSTETVTPEGWASSRMARLFETLRVHVGNVIGSDFDLFSESPEG